MWWRAGLLLLGLAFTSMAALCVWAFVTSPGHTLRRVSEVMHGGLFGTIGVTMAVIAIRASEATARSVLTTFIGDVFGRRNLREFAAWRSVIGATIAVAVHRLRG